MSPCISKPNQLAAIRITYRLFVPPPLIQERGEGRYLSLFLVTQHQCLFGPLCLLPCKNQKEGENPPKWQNADQGPTRSWKVKASTSLDRGAIFS